MFIDHLKMNGVKKWTLCATKKGIPEPSENKRSHKLRNRLLLIGAHCLWLFSGADGAGEPDALPRHPEAEEPSAPVPERIIPRRLVGGCAREDDSRSQIGRQLRAGRRPFEESGHGSGHPHSAVGRRQGHVAWTQLSHHQRLRGRTHQFTVFSFNFYVKILIFCRLQYIGKLYSDRMSILVLKLANIILRYLKLSYQKT